MASNDDDGTVIIIISSVTRSNLASSVTVHPQDAGKDHAIAALEAALAKLKE